MKVGAHCQLRNNRFRTISAQIKKQERAARDRTANVGASVARRLAPVDTGYLKSQIAVLAGGYGVIRLVSAAPYSGFVNGGTVFVAPRPFFSKATEEMRKQLPKEYRRMKVR